MKVLVVMDAIDIGGISSAFINFVKELDKVVDCDILVFDNESIGKDTFPQSITVVKANWPIKLLGMPQKKVKEKSWFWACIRTAFVMISKVVNGNFARRILLLFTKKLSGYDIAISYSQDVGWKTLARGCNDFVLHNVDAVKKCAYIHCDYERFGGYHKKQENTYRRFNYILCVSNGCRNSFVRCFPDLKDKTIVMENFTDVDLIQYKALEENLPRKNCKNIITICRISEEKGIHRTVRVLEKLKNEGYVFCWTIVGDGADYHLVEEMIKEKEMTDFIEMVGLKKNPFPYLKNADVFLLPSYHEAAPMVFGECWALGIPVISTETSSAREMVEDQGIGFVCENSENGLYVALKGYLDGKLNSESLMGLREQNVNNFPLKHLHAFLKIVG